MQPIDSNLNLLTHFIKTIQLISFSFSNSIHFQIIFMPELDFWNRLQKLLKKFFLPITNNLIVVKCSLQIQLRHFYRKKICIIWVKKLSFEGHPTKS